MKLSKSIEIDMRMKRNAAITELPAQLMTCQQFKSTFLKPLIGSLGFRKLRGHLGALAVLYISFADFACDRSANWEDDQLYSLIVDEIGSISDNVVDGVVL